ncbi:MAG: hypothetical protein N5P05_001870 [Chroococcopsis gigantea SAG 12.99]|nr:hypothetical protein [Chroococcopsis gigantea SAG 12.99]
MLKIKAVPGAMRWAIVYFLLLGLISVILGQDASWDLRNYHFYNPYMLLEGRFKYDVLPAQIQTFFNPLMDVPFFMSIHWLKMPPVVFGFLLGGFHGLNIWLVHQILYYSLTNVSEKYREIMSFAGAITGIRGAAYLSELGTNIGDSTSSVFVLGGVAIVVYELYRNRGIKTGRVFLAGLLLGLATGLKLTTAIYSVSLIIAINFLPNKIRDKVSNLVSLISGMGLGFLGTAGYWFLLMWNNFANPVFPFFNTIFKSPYIETDSNLQDLRFLPKDIYQTLFYPFYFAGEQSLVAEVKFRDIRIALAYIFIVMLVGYAIYRLSSKSIPQANHIINPHILSFLTAFYVTAYVIWQKGFSIYRYLLVLELLTPVLLVLILGYIYPHKKAVMIISLTLFALIITTVKPLDWWRIGWSENYFGINSNELQRYENSTIVLYGDEPTSYIAPYFPGSTRFVRLKGNAGIREGTKMRANAEAFIEETPERNLYILKTDANKKSGDTAKELAQEDLGVMRQKCQPLSTHLEKYEICRLDKLDEN